MSDIRQANGPNDDAWAPCPAGELAGLAGRLRQDDRRRQSVAALKTMGAVAAGAAVMVLAVGWWQGPIAERPRVEACAACMAEFDALNQHLTGGPELPADRYQPTWRHLAECEKCQRAFEQRYPGLLQQAGMKLAAWAAWLFAVEPCSGAA